MAKLRDRWRTPPEVMALVRQSFRGEPFVDPCTEDDNPTGAALYYTEEQDGLASFWWGMPAYVNPPYSNIIPWVERMVGRETGILCAPLGLETRWCRTLYDKGWSLVVPQGRIRYLPPPGVKASSPRAPTGLYLEPWCSTVPFKEAGWSVWSAR